MTVTLITFTKKGDPKSFDLTKPKVVIGRKTDADLRIPLADISRSHCEFSLVNGNVTVRDLDSSNGTFVNGEQVDAKEVAAGDEIRLGPVIFTVQIDGKPDHVQPPKPSAAAGKAGSQAPTVASKAPAETEDLDIDDMDDFDIDDISDLDLDEDFSLDDEDLDEVDELEEIDENDVIEDDK